MFLMKRFFHSTLLLMLGFYAPETFACLADMDVAGFDSNDLRGFHDFNLAKGKAKLILIRQKNEDIKLLVTSTESEKVIESPDGRNGSEFIYLEAPAQKPMSYQICIFPASKGSLRSEYDIQEYDIPSSESGLREQLRKINQAGYYWALNTPDSRKSSILLYKEISDSGITDFNINQYASLYSAITYIQFYEYSAAQKLLIPLSNNNQEPYIQFRSTWQLGLVLVGLDQVESGLEKLQQARELGLMVENTLETSFRNDFAAIDNVIGEIYLELNDIKMGETYLLQAKNEVEEEYRLLGKIYNNLGYLELKKSYQSGLSEKERKEGLSQALDEHMKARLFSIQAGDQVELVAIENNLAYINEILGELRNAHQHYREALRILNSSDDDFGLMVLLNNIGILSRNLGDYPKSESYLRQAITIAENLNQSFRFTIYCSLGMTLRLQGKIDEARTEHSRCADLISGINGQERQLLALLEVSEDYKALNNEQEAWRYIEAAWKQIREETPYEISSRIITNYAFLLHRRGGSNEALAIIENVLFENSSGKNRSSIIDSAAVHIKILADLDRRKEAISHGFKLLDDIESVYSELEAERLGPSWSARIHESYVYLAELLLEEYFATDSEQYLIEAFEVVDRSRAISIRQQFSRDLPQDIQNEEENHRLDLLSQIANDYAGLQIAGISTILPASYYQQHDLLSLSRLSGIDKLPVPESISLANIQTELNDGQAVLYFLVAEFRTYVFTITNKNLRLDFLGDTRQLDRLVESALETVRSPGRAYENLFELADFLLAPIDLTAIDDVIIVPHKNLHNFPFAALPIQNEDMDYVPFVAEFSLSTVPSLSAFFMEKNKTPSPFFMDVAILADPVFEKSQLENDLAELNDLGDIQKWSDQLYPLPYTAIEAQNLTSLFSADKVLALTGNRASRNNLLSEEVRNSRILHIATHGYFNSSNDDNVGLALSSVDEEGNANPGFITLPDLFGYSFNNELVVISGCDTTMGRVLSGEGMMGISRGFIAQGAKHVISTLWQVSDRASAVFMEAFYRNLVELGNVAKALQAAQQELQQDPMYRNPYYWASYILTSVNPDQDMIFPDRN